MKRIVYSIIILAAVSAVIVVGYYFRYRGIQETQSLRPGEVPGSGGAEPITLPPIQETAPETEETWVPDKLVAVEGKDPVKIVAGQVLDYFVYSATSSVVFQADGQIALLSQSGAEVLSNTEIEDILQADFSYDGKKLMVVFGKRKSPQASIFDIEAKSWLPLADTVYSFAWSPADARLAYLTKTGAGYEIKTLDTAKANARPQTVVPLLAEDVQLNWPRPGQILVLQTPSAKVPGSLLKIDVTRNTITPLIQDRSGLDILWSGVSDWGLVFVSGFGKKGGELRLVDGDGRRLTTISFLTLPEKCTFYSDQENKEYLICGVPLDDTWSTSVLPDTYLKKEIFSSDWLYRVDMKTGDVEAIYDYDDRAALDAVDLMVKDGVLYFKNRLDGSLYGLAL